MPLRKKGLFHRGGRSHHHHQQTSHSPPPRSAVASSSAAPSSSSHVPGEAALTAAPQSKASLASSSEATQSSAKVSAIHDETVAENDRRKSFQRSATAGEVLGTTTAKTAKKPLESHFLKQSPSSKPSQSPVSPASFHSAPPLHGSATTNSKYAAAPGVGVTSVGETTPVMEHMELLPPSIVQQQQYTYDAQQPYYTETKSAPYNAPMYQAAPSSAAYPPSALPPLQSQPQPPQYSPTSYYTPATTLSGNANNNMVMPLPTVNVAVDELLYYHHQYLQILQQNQPQPQQSTHITPISPSHEATIHHLEKICNAIQLLHQAILTEYEEYHYYYGDKDQNGEASSLSWMPSYDPANIFLKLQSVTAFYQDYFHILQKQYEDYRKRIKQRLKESENNEILEKSENLSRGTSADVAGNKDENNDDDYDIEAWEIKEQYTWDIWEESIWICAALAKTCIGPAWKQQIKERKAKQQSLMPRTPPQHPKMAHSHSLPSPIQQRASATTHNSSPSFESNPQSASYGDVRKNSLLTTSTAGTGGNAVAGGSSASMSSQRHQQQPQRRRLPSTRRQSSIDDDSQVTSGAVVVTVVNQETDGISSSPSTDSSVSSSPSPHRNSFHPQHHHHGPNYPPPPPLSLASPSSATMPSTTYMSLSSTTATPSLLYSSTTASVESQYPPTYFQNSNRQPLRHRSPYQRAYSFIPEVLPLSMLRFAAVINETNIIPPIRKLEWTIPVDCTVTITAVATKMAETESTSEDNAVEKRNVTPDAEEVSSLVREEQKWLIRRQRIGDAQRELVLNLCCSADDVTENAKEGIETEEKEESPTQHSSNIRGEWTILGGRIPVTSMLKSWLETSTAGWVSEKGPTDSVLTDAFDDASSIDSSSTPEELEEECVIPGADDGDDDDREESNSDDDGSEADEHKTLKGSIDVKEAKTKSRRTKTTREEIEVPWGDIVDVGALDWWHTLQVTRAAADLVSQGWCPPPSSSTANSGIFGSASSVIAAGGDDDDIVRKLLTIAQKGVLLSSADTKCSADDTDQDAREERLAASSSAAEASSALSGLGSTGHILCPSLDLAAVVLCRLLAASDATMSVTSTDELFPLDDKNGPVDAAEEEEWRLEKDTFLSQRESCLADAAETLWALLANEKSADTTIAAMLRMMDVNLSSSSNVTLHHHAYDHHQKASGIIRALGAALWGNPPSVKGVPILRIYWSTFLAMSGKVASTIHYNESRHHLYSSETSMPGLLLSRDDSTIGGVSSITTAERKSASKMTTSKVLSRHSDFVDDSKSTLSTSSITTERTASMTRITSLHQLEILPPPSFVTLKSIASYESYSLVVVLEIAVAIRRLVDGEMVAGGGLLSSHEWDALIAAIENGLVPWLDYNYSPAGNGDNDGDSQNHESQEHLGRNEFLYWRINAEVRAVFTQVEVFLNYCTEEANNSCHRIVDDKCRQSLHLLLLRKASILLSPVNAKSLAIATVKSWMAVKYLPLPRGEWSKTSSSLLCQVFATYEDPSYGYLGGGYVHSPAVRLEVLHSIMSPLTLTPNIRGLHLDFVNSLLLPYLKAALFPKNSLSGETIINRAVVFPIPSCPRAETFCTAETLDDEIALRKNSVRILGKLFRSVTGERHHRVSLIETLRLVAVNGSNLVETVMNVDNFSNKRACFTKEKLLKASYEISLEAIQQLELCLRAPFDRLPHTHETVPMIVDAICSVMEVHGIQPSEKTDIVQNRINDPIASSLLTIACIIPLARIRMALDSHVSFLARSKVTRNIPSSVEAFINYHAEGSVRKSSSDEASSEEQSTVQISSDCEEDNGNATLTAPFIFVHRVKQINSHLRNSSQESSLPNRSQNFKEGTVFNWGSIISAMKRVLHYRLQKGNNELFESFTSQFDPNDLSGSIRIIIYSTLHDLMSCGIPFETEDGLPCFFLGAPDDPKTDDEAVARLRALALYSSIFGGHLQRENLRDETKEIKSLNREASEKLQKEPVYIELMEACNSHVVARAMHGCRGVSVLMSLLCAAISIHERDDILSSIDLMDASNDSWPLAGIEAIFLNMKSVIARVGTNNDENDCIDPVVPILSVLYDLFTLCKHSAASIPRKMRIQTFAVCNGILSSGSTSQISWQGRVLALQCAAAVIGFMSQDEVVTAMDETAGNRQAQVGYQDATPGKDEARFSGLVFDLLRRRFVLGIDSTPRYNQEASVHLKIAKETEDIESFNVCKDDPNNPKGIGVWMCADTLLMFRFGAAGSRHQGWVEITLRSPSCRLRHLLRLSSCNSVKDPDFPSPLWDDMKTDKNNRSQKSTTFEKGDTSSIESNREVTHDLSKSEVIGNAYSLINRFNEQLGAETRHLRECYGNHTMSQGDALNPGMNPTGRRRSIAVGNSTHSGRRRSITEEKKQTKSGFWGYGGESPPKQQESKGLKRSHSAGDISLENPSPSEESGSSSTNSWSEPTKSKNVFRWLQFVLIDSSDSVDNIIEHIRTLGISDQLIGLPESSRKEETKVSLFDRTMHHLQVGPRLLRAISILDRTPTFQTHKIALLYARSAGINEKESHGGTRGGPSKSGVLDSIDGSPGFTSFANRLGTIVSTRHLKYFSGGLDTSSYAADGEFTLAWIGNEDTNTTNCDPITAKSMVLFHAVNLMPIGINNRKRHVGNDVVHIVYVENDSASCSEFRGDQNYPDDGTSISGDFGFVTIFVVPFSHTDDARVSLRIRGGLDTGISTALLHLEGNDIVPKNALGTHVRQLAIRADLACRSVMEERLGLVSNWEERLLQIRAMERYIEKGK